MSCSTSLSDSNQSIQIKGELTLPHLEEVRVSILEIIETGTVPGIDMTGVTAVDTAGLQFIISVQKTAEKRGIGLAVTGIQENVQQAAAMSGFNLHFYNI